MSGGIEPTRLRSRARTEEARRVAAFTPGRTTPSARFRVRQLIAPLRNEGYDVREFMAPLNMYRVVSSGASSGAAVLLKRAASALLRQTQIAGRMRGLYGQRRAALTWLQRHLVPGKTRLVGHLKRPMVMDVDDAVWLLAPDAERTYAEIAGRAAAVIAGNRYLAEWLSGHNPDVSVVPTAIDTDRFQPASRHDGSTFEIAWTGIAWNYPHLNSIEEPLALFLERHPDARLLVIADRPPRFDRVPADRVRYVEWSPVVEASSLATAQVGVMPLPDTAWTRGKCSLKMLQYMSCAMPVIVSPVGTNAEILSMSAEPIGSAADDPEEWLEALERLYQDRDRARELGRNGRRVAVERFATSVVARQVAAVFDRVLANA